MEPYQIHTSKSFNALYFTNLNDNMSLIEIENDLLINNVGHHSVSYGGSNLLPNEGYSLKVNNAHVFFLHRTRQTTLKGD